MDRYDNTDAVLSTMTSAVVEVYRLDRYDNFSVRVGVWCFFVVEVYRLDRYDNFFWVYNDALLVRCRSLSFG